MYPEAQNQSQCTEIQEDGFWLNLRSVQSDHEPWAGEKEWVEGVKCYRNSLPAEVAGRPQMGLDREFQPWAGSGPWTRHWIKASITILWFFRTYYIS